MKDEEIKRQYVKLCTYLSVVLYGDPAYWLTEASSTPPRYIDTKAKSSVLLYNKRSYNNYIYNKRNNVSPYIYIHYCEIQRPRTQSEIEHETFKLVA